MTVADILAKRTCSLLPNSDLCDLKNKFFRQIKKFKDLNNRMYVLMQAARQKSQDQAFHNSKNEYKIVELENEFDKVLVLTLYTFGIKD